MHISIKFHLTVHNITLTMILPKSNMQKPAEKKFSTSYPHVYYGVNSPKYVTNINGLKGKEISVQRF